MSLSAPDVVRTDPSFVMNTASVSGILSIRESDCDDPLRIHTVHRQSASVALFVMTVTDLISVSHGIPVCGSSI